MAGQSVREIKRRITSVKNTKQITKAMEMVSAAKLRRSQHQVTAGRPFAGKLREVLSRIAHVHGAGNGDGGSGLQHPLLEVREVKRVLHVLITADRGLAGGYNANLIRHFSALVKDEPHPSSVIAVGRKGRDFLVKNGITPEREYLFLGDEIDFMTAKEIAQDLMRWFIDGVYDEINVVYSQFISAVTQRPTTMRLLPLGDLTGDEAESAERSAEQGVGYIYEPSPEEVLNILLPRYVETEVYRILLEAKASEHGARMTAMRSASDNADEMIEMLTLNYNRARQAGITKEISEIVGGAEAIAAD